MKKINQNYLSFILLSLLGKRPVMYFFGHLPFYSNVSQLIWRLLLGVLGIGSSIYLAIIILGFQNHKIYDLLAWIGGFTLEIYVVHIALRAIIIQQFKISPDTNIQLFIVCGYLCVSIILGYGLNQITNIKNIKRG